MANKLSRDEAIRLNAHTGAVRASVGNPEVEIELVYTHEHTGIQFTHAIEVSVNMAKALIEAMELYRSSYLGPQPAFPGASPDEQVMVMQRSTVMWDEPGTSATLEIGSDDLLHIDTGWRGLMHLTTGEASRFANAIGRLVATMLGKQRGKPFRPEPDCVHCQDDLVHDRHETAAQVADRGRQLTKLLRVAKKPDV